MKDKCSIGSCSDGVYCSGLCRIHYQYTYRWMKAGVSRAHKHRNKLLMRQQCIEDIGPANVVHLPRRKRA